MSINPSSSGHNKAERVDAEEKAAWRILSKSVVALLEHGAIKLDMLAHEIQVLRDEEQLSEPLIDRTMQLATEIFNRSVARNGESASSSDPEVDVYALLGQINAGLNDRAPFKLSGRANLQLQHILLKKVNKNLLSDLQRDTLLLRWAGEANEGPRREAEALLQGDPKFMKWTALMERLPNIKRSSEEYRCMEVFDSLWHLPNVDRGELLQLLFRRDTKRNLNNLMRRYQDELLGKQGRFAEEVERLLSADDDTLERLQLPVVGAADSEAYKEAIRAEKQKYLKQWQMLKERILSNSAEVLFQNDVSDELGRAYFYYHSLCQLYQVWQLTAATRPWMLLDEIGEFIEHCQTGWKERILALLVRVRESSEEVSPSDVYGQPLIEACLERRRVLEETLFAQGVTDVHGLAAAKQLLNEDMALSYSSDELGNAEQKANLRIVSTLYAKNIQRAILHLDPPTFFGRAQAYCELIGEGGRQVIIETLVERYHESSDAGNLLLSAQDMQALESDRAELRAWLESAGSGLQQGWKVKLQQLFYSADRGRYLLPEGVLRTPEEGENLAAWRQTILTRLDNIVRIADGYAFRQAIEDNTQLSELGLQLWLGSLGVITYREQKFEQLMLRLCPEYAQMHSEEMKKELVSLKERVGTPPYALYTTTKQARPVDIGAILTQIPPRLLKNPEWLLKAIKICPVVVNYIAPSLRKQSDILKLSKKTFKAIAEQIAEHPSAFDVQRFIADIPAAVFADRRWVLAVVHLLPELLQGASEKMCRDPDIVMEALSRDSGAIVYVSRDLLQDSAFMREAITKCGVSLEYATDEQRDNWELVEAAIKRDGDNFQYASERLRANRALALEGLRSRPSMIDYVSAGLREDQAFWKQALMDNLGLLEHLPEELLADDSFMFEAVQQMLTAPDSKYCHKHSSYVFSRIAKVWPAFTSKAQAICGGELIWPLAAPIDCLYLFRRRDCGPCVLHLLDHTQASHRQFVIKRMPEIIEAVLATSVPLYMDSDKARYYTLHDLTQFLKHFLTEEELRSLRDDSSLFASVIHRFAKVVRVEGHVGHDHSIDYKLYQQNFIKQFDDLLDLMGEGAKANPGLMLQVAATVAYSEELVGKLLTHFSHNQELCHKIKLLLLALNNKHIRLFSDQLSPQIALLCCRVNPSVVGSLPPDVLQNIADNDLEAARQAGLVTRELIQNNLTWLSATQPLDFELVEIMPLLKHLVDVHILQNEDLLNL